MATDSRATAVGELNDIGRAILTAELMRCWPWLEKAIQSYGPTHEREHVLEAILEGRAQLWPGPDSVIVTTIRDYPTGFKEIEGWLAGGTMAGVLKLEEQAAKWAKEIGCDRVVLVSREGFRRTMAPAGYRQKQIILTKELR